AAAEGPPRALHAAQGRVALRAAQRLPRGAVVLAAPEPRRALHLVGPLLAARDGGDPERAVRRDRDVGLRAVGGLVHGLRGREDEGRAVEARDAGGLEVAAAHA